LTKKFLKKNDMRDIFRVVAINPTSYKLKWYEIAEEEEDEE
jgi:large subunit ribosomal protein L22e